MARLDKIGLEWGGDLVERDFDLEKPFLDPPKKKGFGRN